MTTKCLHTAFLGLPQMPWCYPKACKISVEDFLSSSGVITVGEEKSCELGATINPALVFPAWDGADSADVRKERENLCYFLNVHALAKPWCNSHLGYRDAIRVATDKPSWTPADQLSPSKPTLDARFLSTLYKPIKATSLKRIKLSYSPDGMTCSGLESLECFPPFETPEAVLWTVEPANVDYQRYTHGQKVWAKLFKEYFEDQLNSIGHGFRSLKLVCTNVFCNCNCLTRTSGRMTFSLRCYKPCVLL